MLSQISSPSISHESAVSNAPVIAPLQRALPYLALIFVNAAFSGWHVLGKLALNSGAAPVTFALYRELLSSVLLLVAARATHPGLWHFPIYTRKWLLLLGFCSFVNVVGFIIGLSLTSAFIAAVFQPFIPVAATIIATITKMEPLTLVRLLGMAVAVAGAAVTAVASSEGGSAAGAQLALGLCVLAAQVFAAAALMLICKRLTPYIPPLSITALYYSCGAFISLPFIIAVNVGWPNLFAGAGASSFDAGGSSQWVLQGWQAWAALTYAVTFATCMTWTLVTWCSARLPGSTVALFSTLQPLFTGILGLIVLHEGVSLQAGLGGAAIVFGLAVCCFKVPPPPPPLNTHVESSMHQPLLGSGVV